MSNNFSRRAFLKAAGISAGALATGSSFLPSRRTFAQGDEEYVWISANANLPLFVAHDHPALQVAGEELGVQVTIAGPDTVDIPGMVATIEQVAARNPAGIMVVGWDPSALIAPINAAIEAGIPVVTVDADVPGSKRLSFVGTDWFDLGVRQGEAMVRGLTAAGITSGRVSLMGLIAGDNMQRGFAGFRSVVSQLPDIVIMEPQEDRGNQAEATAVAAAIIQGTTDLVGMAGFDSESGPGIGQAVREAGLGGTLVVTCVDAEEQHLRLVQDGIITAAVGQKRELFTYQGVKALYEVNHPKVTFTSDDTAAGIIPISIMYSTGTYTATAENIGIFLPD
jgi:ABC-type sugar transport system substrate-binding protein